MNSLNQKGRPNSRMRGIKLLHDDAHAHKSQLTQYRTQGNLVTPWLLPWLGSCESSLVLYLKKCLDERKSSTCSARRTVLFPVLLLGWGIAEIPLNVFISRMNGRLACLSICRKWKRPKFFNNQCSLILFFLFFVGTITLTYYDWSAALSLTNGCNCHRGLNVCRADNMKWTLLDFSFSLKKKKQNIVAAEE